ncbi:MAG: M23 family metallopeptidase [Magnetococcales bacterium]|nr:M23 family metallopeptidase [Magnetococcales bacterium]MBF0149647.1 M23 family metallopeptidase [Magnetococcales bacterium]
MIRSVCLLWLLLQLAVTAEAATLKLSAPLEQGTAVFLNASASLGTPDEIKWSGTLNGIPFPLTSDGEALIALDMEAPPGKVTIEVTATGPHGVKEVATRVVTVGKRTYQEEHVTLPEGQVTLSNKEDEERVQRETEAIKATFKIREGKVGFIEGFRLPVTGRFSGVFGSRRILNGKPRRPHNGVDIAAPKGTIVPAPASGMVVLVGNDYLLTGNTLVLNHGHGVMTLYAHLDSINVAMGQWVPKGQTIGTVGTTGRSTGPHLHWGTMVRGQRVDPMRLPGLEKSETSPQ